MKTEYFFLKRLFRRYFSSKLVEYIFLIYLPSSTFNSLRHLSPQRMRWTSTILGLFPAVCMQHTYLLPRSPTARIRQSEIQIRDKCEVSTLTRSGTQIVVGGAKGSEKGRGSSPPNFPFLFSVLSISGHSPILTITPREHVGYMSWL